LSVNLLLTPRHNAPRLDRSFGQSYGCTPTNSGRRPQEIALVIEHSQRGGG
jgi:hypothetical protein